MFRNNSITTREDFKKHCLRKLGAPVISINVSDDQVEDRIDDALNKYWEYHDDGSYQTLLKIEITQEILDNKYIPLPDGIINVPEVVGPNYGSAFNKDNLQYVSFIQNVFDLRQYTFGGFSQYTQTISYLGMMNDLVGKSFFKNIDFNMQKQRLDLLDDKFLVNIGDFIVLRAHVCVDPNVFSKAWNTQWLKEYATALIQMQWANNLIKFPDANLPGNISINANGILEQAEKNIEKLDAELKDAWQAPPIFYFE